MKASIDRLVITAIVLLALVALWLVFNAPETYLNVHAVYQGF
jgi:hypothetical protein